MYIYIDNCEFERGSGPLLSFKDALDFNCTWEWGNMKDVTKARYTSDKNYFGSHLYK